VTARAGRQGHGPGDARWCWGSRGQDEGSLLGPRPRVLYHHTAGTPTRVVTFVSFPYSLARRALRGCEVRQRDRGEGEEHPEGLFPVSLASLGRATGLSQEPICL
jgi:hypothetical protein